jgi:osmoprotectant transport system ATP-binding protein
MIELDRVSKSHDGGKTFAVRDVSFRIPPGKLLALLGEAGSGKTTTLKMVNRLIEPTSGTIRIDGQDVRSRDPVELRRTIGYVVQGSGLFPHLNVEQNIGVVPKLLGWDAETTRTRAWELLEMVGLPAEFASRWPDQLSGGQQQRVGLARALAAGAKIMLLDEPFGALDPISRDQVRGKFRDIQQKLGLTAVMVTHDVTEALLLADLVAVMKSPGRLEQIGTPHDLLTSPKTDFVRDFISAPQREAKQLEEQWEKVLAERDKGESR